ncbi:hypothetical protein ACQEPB_00385 [Novosphingobium fluoreni]|uniref:hypothetical protein n=1 Tax=Novosphingobium fluoreni TaxID=1391222 RepID=UPI003D9FEB66
MAEITSAIATIPAAETPTARAAALTQENDDMARQRTARALKDDDSGEIKAMDFAQAKKLYLDDIKPAQSEASSQAQTVGEAFKVIKKGCHIQPQSAKAAFKAFEMEDARRDDHLRGFAGMLNELMGRDVLTFHSNDLVDQAQAASAREPARPKPKLVTLPDHPKDDSDLADAGDEPELRKPTFGDGSIGGFTEATDEELAQQEGRGTAH